MAPSRGAAIGKIKQQSQDKLLLKAEVYSELIDMLGINCTMDAFSPSLTCNKDPDIAVPLPPIKYKGEEFFTKDTSAQVVLLYPEVDRVAEALCQAQCTSEERNAL